MLKGVEVGKLSRTKGHSFERWVAIQLRHIFPNCRRHLEYQDAEANGVDLVNTGRYMIQCKRGRKYSSISAIKEVSYEPLTGEVPILITKADGEIPLAVIPFDELIELIGKTTPENKK